MKNPHNLTSIQLAFIIIQTQIGVGILGLPYGVFGVSKQDAWISVLLSGLIIQVIIVLLWWLASRFPTKTIFHYSTLLTGKFVGTLINMSFIVYGLLVTSIVLVQSTAIIKMWALPLTPKWIIMLMLVATSILLGKEEIMSISNIYVVVSILILFLILLTIVVVIIYPVDWRYLFPMGATGIPTILKGMKEAYFSMLGFEILLVMFPFFYKNGSKSILYAASSANLFVTLVYAFLTVVTIVTFSPEEILTIPQPVLYYVKFLYLQVVERIDLVFVSVWVVNVITSLTSYFFLSTEGTTIVFHRFKRVKRVFFTIIIATCSYIIAMLPNKAAGMEIINKAVISFSYLHILGFPILFLAISLIFKKVERGEDS